MLLDGVSTIHILLFRYSTSFLIDIITIKLSNRSVTEIFQEREKTFEIVIRALFYIASSVLN